MRVRRNQLPNCCFLIRKLISQGSPKNALVLYNQDRRKGASYSYILPAIPLLFKACASLSNLHHGKALHGQSIRAGFHFDIVGATSLLHMYAKCGDTFASSKVFDNMPHRNVVTWNAMIGGYLKNGDEASASLLFWNMPMKNTATWTEMIRGVAAKGDTVKARELFDKVPPALKSVVVWTVMVEAYARNGEMESARKIFEQMPERNCFAWSSMISGYCKRGNTKEARAIFDRIPYRNLVNWNSLISGYAQNGLCEKALGAFFEMQTDEFEPDEFTIASALSACAQLGQLRAGKEIHCMIYRRGIKFNQFIFNALLDMYAKGGDLINSRLIFDGMTERNTACWNAMISSFTVHGQTIEALEFFRTMEDANEKPDGITFLSLLSACAHGGFVEEGLEIFSKMEGKYGLAPNVKHYGCLVDILGRAGKLKEAYDVIKKMPMKPNDAVWVALLGACRIHVDMDMAEKILEEVNRSDLKCSGNDSQFVLVSNVYAASDAWEKAERMMMAMVSKGIKKTPGCSSVVASDTCQRFR
ncbi:pentatricopeptide repeat-containing protein At3g21470 [Carica papaya]|uniref:pentatricopeptide repeat-containing protein At3g21470 n=1 Tax=Carica papaya TaxID=3649 RepID=UPI000B8CB387|nr:pentatricopeptide repeat-containing protein At3g21470 [Carica papaya]